ncbi:MAG: MFS transporter [Alphaproteobacteria bacterium]
MTFCAENAQVSGTIEFSGSVAVIDMPKHDAETALTPTYASSRAQWAWCFYDWANSAFATLITTFIFATYYAEGVVGASGQGDAEWARMVSLAGLSIAVLAPVLGAIADQGGRLKPWLGVFTALMVGCAFGRWFVQPDPSSAWLCLMLVGTGIVAFELAMVFYNAMLPRIAPPDRIGRLSGLGWGLGYAGGLTCLVIALFGLIGLGETLPPLLDLGEEAREQVAHIRATGPLVGLWILIFATPLFLLVPLSPGRSVNAPQAVRQGLSTLWHTIRSLPQHAQVAWFLVASMFYRDGLNTLFALGGIFAAVAIGLETSDILIFAIGLNVTSGIGAVVFGMIDDRIGAEKTIMVSVGACLILALCVLFAQDKWVFIGLALVLGVFVGPAQASGRSLMARLAPKETVTEFFGLYALTGKATSFLGPMMYSLLAVWGADALGLDKQDAARLGMSAVGILLGLGLILMVPVLMLGRKQAGQVAE